MRKDIWTEIASKQYEQNIEYLLTNWSEKDALNFIEHLESILYDLKTGAVDYGFTEKDNVRKCVICKQISMFYQINQDNDIELLSFWNNYQDDLNNPYT